MAVQRFIVGSALKAAVEGYALGPYRPLTMWHEGERVRNPHFDAHSQHVLNIKFPSTKYFRPSALYCYDCLADFLQNGIRLDTAEFLIVPSSRQQHTSEGLERIVMRVCRLDKRFTYRPGSLFRHKAINKLAKGGDRSLGVHLNSMGYKDDPYAPHLKIILDDVLTTGNSMRAAMTVIEQVNQRASFVPVVLGKTTHD